MKKTIFSVPKMDCPSEEKLVRLAIGEVDGIEHLKFDLEKRKLTIFHEGSSEVILNQLAPLNFGAAVLSSEDMSEMEEGLLLAEKAKDSGNEKAEAKVLKLLLAINAGMFLLEIVFGFVAQSTGLIADAMDMFADAAVYGISLYAVGKAISLQRKAAKFSGYAQMVLVLFALFEVIRRFIYGSEPLASYMIAVSFLALIANVTCFVLITRHRSNGIHMKASAIFSANDVIANCGVILAGVLVTEFKSPLPDLIIGLLISVIVFRGAISIIKISRSESNVT